MTRRAISARPCEEDNNGDIELCEVITAMEQVGRKVRLSDFMRVLGVADENMDQKISFAEFVNLFETSKVGWCRVTPTPD